MFSFLKRGKEKPRSSEAVTVYPRLKTSPFEASLKSLPGMSQEQMPIIRPLVGDLLLTYAIDTGDQYQFLTSVMLAERGLTAEKVHEQAMQNLIKAFEHAELVVDGEILRLTLGNNLEACSLLYSDFWVDATEKIGSRPVAIFPHRDVVCFSPYSNPQGVSRLIEIVETSVFEDNHALSRNIHVFENGKWHALARGG